MGAGEEEKRMQLETLAVHGGFAEDPATHAVAVPIYQTAAYAFDSADHGAALFDLEVEGYRYSRISNPTTAVLEERVAAMEGGVGALAVASGQAALHYAFVNVADSGGHHATVRRGRHRRRGGAHDQRRHQGRILREHRQSGREHH
jgi:O-acetylhomoserine (thiol)-lyase